MPNVTAEEKVCRKHHCQTQALMFVPRRSGSNSGSATKWPYDQGQSHPHFADEETDTLGSKAAAQGHTPTQESPAGTSGPSSWPSALSACCSLAPLPCCFSGSPPTPSAPSASWPGCLLSLGLIAPTCPRLLTVGASTPEWDDPAVLPSLRVLPTAEGLSSGLGYRPFTLCGVLNDLNYSCPFSGSVAKP